MPGEQKFFATAPRGLTGLLAGELEAQGAAGVTVRSGGVWFEGDLRTAYRACLWSRVASRVLLPLRRFEVQDDDGLYQAVREVDWLDHLAVDGTLAVDAVLLKSPLTHSQHTALRVKDAVVDQFRDRFGTRPSVDKKRPAVRLNLFVAGKQAQLSIDLSGHSLHRRGYRPAGAVAPLKENLAAGLLLLAEWPEQASAGVVFLDPMCGSGTLPIEAALMAADVAPGLHRSYWGFSRWRGHDAAAWAEVLDEARQRDGRSQIWEGPAIVGWDEDSAAVAQARAAVAAAGLEDHVRIDLRGIANWAPAAVDPEADTGVIVVNPPYGKRLGEVESLQPVYRSIGDALKQRFAGWTAHVLSGEPRLGGALGLRSSRRHQVYNGPIECRLLTLPLHAPRSPEALRDEAPEALRQQVAGFVNRLRKRHRHLARWASQRHIHCYRVYDADLPSFNLAVDRYEQSVHVQEYAAPDTVDADVARQRLRLAMAEIPAVLDVAPEDVHFKRRQKQRGRAQYDRQRTLGIEMAVREGGLRFWVNLTDYLDTGLFLDHRETRAKLGEWAAGGRFLNLFAYTGTATVYAAAGGARSTTTVDWSRTYLRWCRRNLALNGLDRPEHELVRADCMTWLGEAKGRYDLIFLDPPTFSNRKGGQTLDVQRDHVALIKGAVSLLTRRGRLVFSTNARRFRLDRDALADLTIDELTSLTLPEDFKRRPDAHSVWSIQRLAGASARTSP